MTEKTDQVKTFEDLETNVLYIMTYAMDLMARDMDRKFRSEGGFFHQHKKMLFHRYTESIRQAIELSRQINDAVEQVTAPGGYKDLDKFAADGNEMARLLLAYADKSDIGDNIKAVFSLLRELPGGGLVTEEKLKRFYLR